MSDDCDAVPIYMRRAPEVSRYEARCPRHGLVETQPVEDDVSDFSQYKGSLSCRELYAFGHDNQCGVRLNLQLIVVPHDD